MPPKTKLILNPMANMGAAWKAASALRPIVEQYGQADWSGTVYPSHAAELAQQAAKQGYERIIALGGDGTVHEVVNGLMRLPPSQRPTLGVVPIGSGNDFAFGLGLPQSAAEALHLAFYGTPQPVDIGHVTSSDGTIDEFFDNTLGIGFDAIVTIRSHRHPLLRGFLMYLVAVFESILLNHHSTRYQLQTDQGTLEISSQMMVACNGGREGGGFLIAPQYDMRDGQMELVIIEAISRPTMLRLLPEFIRGTHQRFSQVHTHRVSRVQLQADSPLYIHADGEILTAFDSNVRALTIEILPAALHVVQPE